MHALRQLLCRVATQFVLKRSVLLSFLKLTLFVNNNRYKPIRKEVMIVPYRSNLDRGRFETDIREPKDHPIILDIQKAKSSKNTQIKMISDIYKDANPLHMNDHPAVIIMPYQISTMNLVELYRLNIPMFCPSLKLLKEWCKKYVGERAKRASRENENEERSDEYYCYASSLRSSLFAQRAVIVFVANSNHQQQQVRFAVGGALRLAGEVG